MAKQEKAFDEENVSFYIVGGNKYRAMGACRNPESYVT